MSHTTPRLTIATYNILADAHIRPEHYPHCDLADLSPNLRHPRLIERVAGLDADILCLQEVDHTLRTALNARLGPMGYLSRWALKRGYWQDGCAIYVRAPWFLRAAHVMPYSETGPDGKPYGHIALIAKIEAHGQILTVINTHLKWDLPDSTVGLRQGLELLSQHGHATSCIICGDFNAEPDSPLLTTFFKASFRDAHPPTALTGNFGGRPKKIDFVLHSADLRVHALPTPGLAADTPLPSPTEPSDHLPLVARF